MFFPVWVFPQVFCFPPRIQKWRLTGNFPLRFWALQFPSFFQPTFSSFKCKFLVIITHFLCVFLRLFLFLHHYLSLHRNSYSTLSVFTSVSSLTPIDHCKWSSLPNQVLLEVSSFSSINGKFSSPLLLSCLLSSGITPKNPLL